jgi:ankyrin repeat protein
MNDNLDDSTESAGIVKMFRLLRNHEDAKFIKYLDSNAALDLNYRDSQENHLITYAIRFNKPDIVKKLLKKGARYDVVDRVGRSILYDAIESDFIDVLKVVLDHSRDAVGIMITDIRDTNGNIPIHYAIKFKNTQAIRLLIASGSKLYMADDDGYNSLHMAVKTKDLQIVKSIVNVLSNLDAKTLKGETALHIAINYQYNDIATHLLEHKADPNITDDESDFTPVHYAVGWNNYRILESLIKHGAQIDSQDIYGNTPLIYCVKEHHDRCFNIIMKQNPDLNVWNIDGKNVLHEVLDSYDEEHSKKYVDSLISNSNVSHQDSHGNTCLHYLVFLGLWKEYIDILKTKRLNIFAQNSNSQMVIDFVENDDYELLIDITVESYLTILRLEDPKMWTDEINKICSRNLTQLTDDQLTVLKKESKSKKSSEKLCSSIIEDRLRQTVADIREGKIECCQKSYPYNVEDVIDLQEGVLLDITTFTGSLLDVLIGLLHLLKIHSNTCSTLSMDSSPNQVLCDFYRSMGLIMSGRCEFLNFEIVWIEYKLYMIDNFADLFNECVESSARFVIIPLGIEMKTGSHANYLIYDKQIKELERFEPHGGTTPIGFNYNSKQLDDILEQYIISVDPDIKYIRPDEFIPKIGFQIMDSQEAQTHRIGDPGGFCALWSIWYVDQRITYPHYSRDRLITELFSNIREKGISYRNLIRNYSRNIIRERDRLLGKVDLDINDWLNERYSNTTLDKFMSILNSEIRDIMKKR